MCLKAVCVMGEGHRRAKAERQWSSDCCQRTWQRRERAGQGRKDGKCDKMGTERAQQRPPQGSGTGTVQALLPNCPHDSP